MRSRSPRSRIIEIDNLQKHVNTRLGSRCFNIEVPFETRQWLIEKGTSPEYGARELKRTIHKNLTQPLATLVAKNQIESGSRVRVEIAADREGLSLRATAPERSRRRRIPPFFWWTITATCCSFWSG